MNDKTRKTLGFIGMLVGLGLILYSFSNDPDSVGSFVKINDKVINVEVSDNFQERLQGLMNRESMDENSGMIFIFEEEKQQTFWMKNTLIPLDLIFVNSNLEIVDIKKDFKPCEEDPCIVYTSQAPAFYVIEVNAGYSDKNNIQIGDSIELTI